VIFDIFDTLKDFLPKKEKSTGGRPVIFDHPKKGAALGTTLSKPYPFRSLKRLLLKKE